MKKELPRCNMKLEQQVCNLELAKRLKDLGVKRESLFYWRSDATAHGRPGWDIGDCIDTHANENFSAFTIGELGEMLPVRVNFGKRKSKPKYFCNYDNKTYHQVNNDSLADAMAEMLIYLLENKLINP